MATIYLKYREKTVATVSSYKAFHANGAYHIKLKYIYADADAISDGLEISDMRDFSLVHRMDSLEITYQGCVWDKNTFNGCRVSQEATVTAASKTEKGWC